MAAFPADLRALAELTADPSVELDSPIPQGDGQTVLRET
jgi:hypothetical protein